MENQMKICFVTKAQFDILWAKTMPQNRCTGDLTTLAYMSRNLNTLFIVGRQEDFISDLDSAIPSTCPWKEEIIWASMVTI